MKKTYLWVLAAAIVVGLAAYFTMTCFGPDRARPDDPGRPAEATTAPRDEAAPDEPTPAEPTDTATAAAETAPADDKPVHTVAGTILDVDKKPVAAAQVILLSGPCTDDTARTTTTDQAGKFRFDSVQAAAVDLVLKCPPDGTPWWLGKVEVSSKSPEELASLEFTLEKACTWTIEAKDDKGKLLAGVSLTVISRNSETLDHNDCPQALGCSMKTDEQGRATFRDLEPGWYGLTARLEGYGTLTDTFGCGAEEPQEKPAVITLGVGGSIVGRVLDPDNRPAEDATVTCHVKEPYYARPELAIATATCDAEGRFRIADLSEGRYLLVASADAFSDGYLPGVRVTPGRQRPECTILLEPAMRLEGRVIDPAQRPVEGATVELQRSLTGEPLGFPRRRGFGPGYGWAAYSSIDLALVTTGPDGKFCFEKAPVKGARVVASKEGYEARDEEVIPGGQPITIVLVPGPVVAGTVTAAETGKPVEKATVYCLLYSGRAETDAQGRYKITDVSPGPRTFIAYAPGLASPALVKATVLNSGTTELDFVLEPNAPITGVVTNARTGEPIEGARVNALAEKESRRRSPEWGLGFGSGYAELFAYADPFEAYTDEQGSFKIPVLLPELTVVVAEARDYLRERVELEGKDLAQPLEIQLKQGAVIAGRVLAPDGTPVAEAEVVCESQEQEEEESEEDLDYGYDDTEERESDENGQFRIGALRPGPYLLTATHDDYAPGGYGPIELSAHEVLDGIEIVLGEGGRIAGVVTDETGAPVEGATVSFAVEVEEEEEDEVLVLRGKGVVYHPQRSAAFADVTTDIDGRYTSGVLPPGAYEVSAKSPPRICHEPQRVVVAPATTVADISFTLEPGIEVSGRALDDQGNPIPGADVRLHHDDWYQATSKEDGTFVIGGLRSQESEPYLYVFAEGYLEHHGPCTVPAHNLEIKLERGGTFVGRVVDKQTQKPVEVFYAADNERNQPPPMEYHPGGRFELKGLKAGEHTILVIADGYATASIKHVETLRGLEPEEVLIELVEGARLTITVTAAAGGQPVPDVEVSSYEMWNEARITGPDGKCAIENLAPGRYEFDLKHEAFADKELRVKIDEDETRKEVKVALDKGLTIRGRVVAKADQQPIDGATVELVEATRDAWFWFEGGEREVETDAGGEFSFEYVTPGRYTLSVEHPDYSPFEQKTRFSKGFDEPILVELTAGGRIVGTVTDAAGVPQSDITVTLLSFAVYGEETEAETDRNGSYVIAHLGPGSYRVAVDPERAFYDDEGGATEIKRTTVREGQDSRVDFVIGGGAAVYGAVTRAGQPVPEVQLMVLPKGASLHSLSGSIGHSRSDQAGRYRIDGLQPGTYSLFARAEGGRRVNREFTIGDKELLLDIEFGGGQIAGWICDELGRPLNAARVRLLPEIEKGDSLTGIYSYSRMSQSGGTTDETGAFTLDDVAPGTYRLYAEAEGYGTQLLTVVKQADVDPSPLQIKLQEQGRLAGRVQAQGGKLPERLLVFVCDDKGRLLTADSSDIDPDTGEWELGGAGSGRYTIVAKVPGYAPVTKQVTVSRDQHTPVVLDLREGNDLVVTVRDSAGKPVPGASVIIKAGDDPLLGAALTYATLFEDGGAEAFSGTDAGGAMALHHVGDGEHTVHVAANGYEPADVEVRVAGNTRNVTVTLKPAKPGSK